MKIYRIDIEFDNIENDYKSIRINLQPPVCDQCGQDHKLNVEMNLWPSKHGPCEKSRHPDFASAYSAAKLKYPELP